MIYKDYLDTGLDKKYTEMVNALKVSRITQFLPDRLFKSLFWIKVQILFDV